MTFTTSEYTSPKRPRWVLPAIGGVVVIALVGVLALAVTMRDSPQPTSPAQRTSTPATIDLTAAPAQLEWKLIDGVRLPYSKIDGPAKVSGSLATGYSHTPQGAVVAAWQISSRLAVSTDYERVMATQVRGTESERTQVRQEVAEVRNLTPDQFSARFKQPIGFQIVSYDPTFAQIYFAVQSPTGGYDFVARAVLWNGKDWQYQLVSGLPTLPNSTSVAGYTLF